MSIRGLTSLIPTFGKSILGTMRSIADYFAAWGLQDDTGAVAVVDNIAVPGEGILDSNQYPGTEALNESGASGTATAANWTSGNSGKLENLVVGELKVSRDGAANPYASQVAMTIGIPYRVAGYVVSDGNATNRVRTSSTISFTGTTSTAPQRFDFEIVADQTALWLQTVTDTGTEYCIFYGVTVKPANPLNGGHTGVAVGQPGQYRIGKVATYNGTAYTEKALAAVSEYDAVYNPTNFTRAIVMRKTTWDTTERWPFQDYVDADNFVGIRDTTTAGTIQFVYKAGGTENVVTWVSGSPTDSKLLDLSVSGGVLEGRVNGVSVGTTAIVGVFAGAFTVFMLGAANDTTGGHLGDLTWDEHFTAKTTDADMVRIKDSMGIPA